MYKKQFLNVEEGFLRLQAYKAKATVYAKNDSSTKVIEPCIILGVFGVLTKLTPRKVYDRQHQKLCLLCGKAIQSTKYGRLFGKVVESKNLCEKIK